MKIKSYFCSLLCLCMLLSLSVAVSQEADTQELILVTSESISAEGRLLTVTAANRSPNKPRGENQSPQLTFTPVEGAAGYALVMFDTTADWLHFLVTGVTETRLPQGAYTNTKQYIGPYPPKGTKDHCYRIEVFALKAAPDKINGKINARNRYETIVKGLDTAGGEAGNILARGFAEGMYAYGDNTPAE